MVNIVYKTFDNKEFSSETEAKEYEKKYGVPARTITFYGHSDDIIIWEDSLGQYDETYKNNLKLLDIDGNGLKIFAKYDGCWGFGINLLDEDIPLPSWPISFSFEGYTTKMSIEVPVATHIEI